jgi:hypothetical protein
MAKKVVVKEVEMKVEKKEMPFNKLKEKTNKMMLKKGC